MKDDLTLGEKLKSFRKRAGISQLELEMRINAAGGMISRIESGETNPTKETLLKIIDILNLSPLDAASLFCVDVSEEINNVINISKTLDLENVDASIDTIIEKIGKFLHTTTVGIWLWDEKLQALKFRRLIIPGPALVLAEKIFGFKINKLTLYANDKKFALNDYLKTMFTEQIVETKDMYYLGYPYFSKTISKILQKMVRMELDVNLPLLSNGKKIGVLGVLWPKNNISENEKTLLQSYADQIATVIYNAKRYQELNQKYLDLKEHQQKGY